MERHYIDYLRAVHPSLSETEARVLAQVFAGSTNQQIASLYGCTLRTIETHRYRIGKKLGSPPSKREDPMDSLTYVGVTSANTMPASLSSPRSRQQAHNPRKRIRARTHTSGSPSAGLSHGRTVAHLEVAGKGSHQSSGRWLLPGVLFQVEANNDPWV